jgi:hypothetical protein
MDMAIMADIQGILEIRKKVDSLSLSLSLCAHSHGAQIKGEVYSHL